MFLDSVIEQYLWCSQVQGSWVLPTQSLSENEQLIEDAQHNEDQTSQEVDKKEQYSEV